MSDSINPHSHSFAGQTIQGHGQIMVSNGYGVGYEWNNSTENVEKRMLEISIENIELNKRIDNLEEMLVKLVSGNKK